jgi:hypothetical protein
MLRELDVGFFEWLRKIDLSARTTCVFMLSRDRMKNKSRDRTLAEEFVSNLSYEE